MTNTSFSINSGKLFLVRTQVSVKTRLAKPVELPVNHVLVIDCSGSMYGDLPRIREQIKRKLPKLLKTDDTLSVIWFSGRGQFGTLLEAEPVATLADLKSVEAAVDRWLRPVSLTGFKEPLEEVSNLVTRVTKKNSNPFSMMFLSDGCDNCWNRNDILKAAETAATCLGSTTIVEYGYYADRPMLASMAEKTGGNLIFAEDFDRYAPAIESVVQRRGTGAKRVDVKISGDALYGFAFSLKDGDINTYSVDNGKVQVPSDVDAVWYLSPKEVGSLADTINSDQANSAAYATLSLLSTRMKPEAVYPILKTLGDVKFIEQFASCFGKQKYTEFMEDTRAAAFDTKLRLTQGYDPTRVPRDDAFTVLDFLQILQHDPDARILVDHPGFKYSRIGRNRVDSNTTLTAAEQKQVDELTEQMKAEKNPKKIAALATQISAITDKPEALKFEATPAPDGYPVNGLVFAEDRPNVSFRVRKEGTVDLSSRARPTPAVPEKFPTFVFRNYTVVKDGMCNIEWLPISCSKTTEKILRGHLKPYQVTGSNKELHVNIKALPIVNRQMVQEASAKTLFENEYQLTLRRAEQKVYSSYKKEMSLDRKSESFAEQYGEDAANWLKEQGITDYSGFNPKSVQAPATDFYMAKELTVSIKNLSTLPSLKDVREKMKAGKKLTPSAELMKPAVEEVETYLGPRTDWKRDEEDFKKWLTTKTSETTEKTRDLITEMAKTKFAIIVGQTWFKEFKSLSENTLTMPFGECKVEMKEVKVDI